MGKSHGRDAALREFIRNRSTLMAFILSIVRNFDFAEEVLQEVAVVVCNQWRDFKPGTNFTAWAAAIARNKIYNLSRVPRREIALAPEAVAGIERATASESDPGWLDALRACLDDSPARVRNVLKLRYWRGLSGAQIARRIKSTEAAVHMALSRARAALARCIQIRLAAGEDAAP